MAVAEVEFREVPFDSPAYHQTLALRQIVLRTPLGLTLSAADLAGEARQRHFVLLENGDVVACVVIRPADRTDVVRLRQMAVAAGVQGRGLGAQLIRRVEAVLRRDGVTEVVMSARQSAVGFYQKLGYQTEGDGYPDLGIHHIRMCKLLYR
jgi:predicted GNAT family N-acyltransferase